MAWDVFIICHLSVAKALYRILKGGWGGAVGASWAFGSGLGPGIQCSGDRHGPACPSPTPPGVTRAWGHFYDRNTIG